MRPTDDLPRAREIELSHRATLAVCFVGLVSLVVANYALMTAGLSVGRTLAIGVPLTLLTVGWLLRWGIEAGTATPVVLVGRRRVPREEVDTDA